VNQKVEVLPTPVRSSPDSGIRRFLKSKGNAALMRPSACWSLAVLAAAPAAVLGADCPAIGADWTTVELDPSISFVVHHKVVDSTTLHVRLEAQNTGWLGFGIAEFSSGHMKGADMVTAMVKNGDVIADDRYADFSATTYSPSTSYANGYQDLTALVDVHNDWTFVSGSEAGGVTSVWLSRPLVTGDHQDRDVVSGPNRIVWSWGGADSVSYHGANRGAGMITFFGSSTAVEIPAHDGKWSFVMDGYDVPSTQITTYACRGFTFPTDKERHIVAFRPINVSQYNHHAIVHICQANSYFDQHATSQLCSYHPTGSIPGTSSNPNSGTGGSPLGETAAGCSGLMYSWAVGMGDFILPEAAGFRVGTGAITHIIMEIHYDNPALTSNVKDHMGFEAYYVENTLRTHDAASIIIGDPIVKFGDVTSAPYTTGHIPAQTTQVHREATCPGSCTTSFSGDITVFCHGLHMHYYGRKIYTEKYDTSGNYVGIAGRRIDYWDNGYQQLQQASYTISPGESLQTHCYWNTAAFSYASEVTFGVPASYEMCMDFLFYYPAQTRNSYPLAMCGVAEIGGVGDITLCGSLSQGYPDFALPISDQVSRGTTNYADPSSFTTANLGALAGTNAAECTMASPSPPPGSPSTPHGSPSPPPPSRPDPSPPPPQEGTVDPVTFEVVASGDVSDYTFTVIDGIKASVASALTGVSASDVSVSVTAGSVRISVTVAVPDTAAQTSVSSQVASNLADTTAATQLVSSQVPTSAGVSIAVSSIVSSPASDSGGGSDMTNIIIAIAVPVAVISLGAIAYVMFGRQKKGASPKVVGVHTVSSTSTS
jgi:hypothetical protein